jgi:hypothetical protein
MEVTSENEKLRIEKRNIGDLLQQAQDKKEHLTAKAANYKAIIKSKEQKLREAFTLSESQ